MAQVSGLIYGSQIVAPKEVIVDELFELDPMDTPFLQMIGAGPNGPLNTLSRPCTQATYQWPEVALTSNRTTLNGAINNSVTALTLTDASWLRAGDRILIDTELIDITTIASGQPSVVVRGVGGTSAASHADLAVVVNLGNARTQGAAAPTDDFVDEPALVTNYTQIFQERVRVAGTVLATEAYGRTNEYELAKAQKMRRIKEQLEHAVLFGGSAVAPSAGSTAGRMKGGLGFITTNAVALGGAQLDFADIQSVMEKCYNAGGVPDVLLCGSFNKRVIANWKLPQVRYEPNGDGSFGTSVGMLDTGAGVLKVVAKRSFPQSLVMIVSSQNVGIGPLTGSGASREFSHTPLAKDGDSESGLVVGEYTCEWRLEKAHAKITGTAVS